MVLSTAQPVLSGQVNKKARISAAFVSRETDLCEIPCVCVRRAGDFLFCFPTVRARLAGDNARGPMPSAANLFDAATRHHQDGRLAEAEALYRQALAADAVHTGSLHGLGLIAHATGHFDVAARLFAAVLAIQPDDAGAQHALAYTLHAQGAHDESAVHYARALTLAPGDARIHNNLGNLAKDRGDFARALDSYTQAIALDPGL